VRDVLLSGISVKVVLLTELGILLCNMRPLAWSMAARRRDSPETFNRVLRI
jgi:hypothetical protein